MILRLQKYIANCGIASRRAAEALITSGQIKVNDIVIDELGAKVDDEVDIVKYNDKVITLAEELVYIMIHKPEDYVTTVKDQFERPTVMDLVDDTNARLYPIGRLDYDTSGLLILTNDGDLTFKLTHPKHNIDKVYVAKIIGVPTDDSLLAFREGLIIDGVKTAPAKIEVIKNDGLFCSIKITIREGKNRQVRKMCEAIGHRVCSLKRIATGKLFLGELKKGEHRPLTAAEVKYLKEMK